MDVFIEPIGRLINEFTKLPGVGKKTAQRYAYKIINMSAEEAAGFAAAINDGYKKADELYEEKMGKFGGASLPGLM